MYKYVSESLVRTVSDGRSYVSKVLIRSLSVTSTVLPFSSTFSILLRVVSSGHQRDVIIIDIT